MQDNRTPWWILAILACVVAAGFWYQRAMKATPEPAREQSLPPPPVAEDDGASQLPDYPVPAAENLDAPADLEPLPALNESDAYFKMELSSLFGEGSAGHVVKSSLIENLVATIDNLPRQKVSERIRALVPLKTPFVVEQQDDSDHATIDERNFKRYDAIIDQFIAADLDRTIEIYHRYYPLFQKAYQELGYPDGYFNDRLVEVIDQLLATPDVTGPVDVVRPNVLYEYADPDLQALSAGQKLLLRVGPVNRARVKERLRELRARITDS